MMDGKAGTKQLQDKIALLMDLRRDHSDIKGQALACILEAGINKEYRSYSDVGVPAPELYYKFLAYNEKYWKAMQEGVPCDADIRQLDNP